MSSTERFYELMFLADPLKSSTNYDEVKAEIERILNKHTCKIKDIRKYGERKLAYVIKKNLQKYERGCYIMVYVNIDPTKIPGIRRDASLSEQIIRLLVIKLDSEQEMESEQEVSQSAAQ